VTNLIVQQIVDRDANTYDVVVQAPDGTVERILCRIVEHKGVMALQAEPDIFMDERINPREISTVVLAHHRRRSG